jgi:hypothetical protein
MPTVDLSEHAFAELKSLAEPFVDTPASLTARLIHEEVVRRGRHSTGDGSGSAGAEQLLTQNPISHESLRHTRLLSAEVDGRELYRPKWNALMEHLHVLALKHLGSFDALKGLSGAQLRKGRFEKQGFKYVPDADFSIQGTEANLTWDRSLKLAQTMQIPIKAVFEWHDKEGAVHPGKRGVLEWRPTRAFRIMSPRLANPHQAADFVKEVVEVSSDAKL